MLDPDIVTQALVTALQSIPEVSSVMGADSDSSRISGHFYTSTSEPRLELAVAQMKTPSMLVAYDSLFSGNFNGQSIFKHQLKIYARLANQTGQTFPIGLGHLWWLMCNRPLASSGMNIRLTNILPELDILSGDNVRVNITQDDDGQDLLYGMMIFYEIGDS